MSTPDSHRDCLPALAKEVLALYADALAQVRFPDLDLDVLTSAAERVHDAQLDVAEALASLERVRATLVEREQELTALAERALAYARVFAAGNAELSERVSALGRAAPSGSTPDPGRTPRMPRKRRGRTPGDANLFEAETRADTPDPADIEHNTDMSLAAESAA